MITKTLQPSDPLVRSPPAIKAIIDELADLREHKVWDEANPVEASEVALKEPEAHIVRVFEIVAIKHFEDKDAQKYKGRIVVSGDKVKTATGQWAVFQEIGIVPSTMAACRILLVTRSATAPGALRPPSRRGLLAREARGRAPASELHHR